MPELNQLLLVPPGITGLAPGVHRVVAVAPPHKLVALARLSITRDAYDSTTPPKHLLKPIVTNSERLQGFLDKGAVSVIPEADARAHTNEFVSAQRQSEKFLKRRQILKSLIDPDILFRMLFTGYWADEIDHAAKHHKVSTHTVLRLLQRYFHVRMDIEAACVRAQRSSDKPRKLVQMQGRRPLADKAGKAQPARRNAQLSDLELIEVFYNSREDKKISVAAMWRQYEDAYAPRAARVTAAGYLELLPNPLQPFLTESQFRYGLRKVIGRLRLLEEEAGKRAVKLNHRVAIGSARDGIPYPGHTYIIDATVADVYLVSAFDVRIIIGRPVIYVVIDAFSSLIVGIHIALEGPNFEQARIAMYRALSDKKAWLDWLGVPGLATLLPQGCRPTFWLADRGELHSEESRSVQLALQTNLSVAAAYRADWKSIVERNFGVLNELCIHWLPGAVKDRVRERGAPDHRLDAVLTLKVFTRIILRICAQLNLTRDMSRHLSAAFIRKDVLANPLGFWHHGIDYLHGSAAFGDADAVRYTVLQTETASLNRHGVFCGKYRFTADWMKDHELVRATGFEGACSVPFVKCPDVPNRGFVLLPHETAQREVQLHSEFSYLNLFAIEDVLEMQAHRKLAKPVQAADTRDVRLALQDANAKDIEAALQAASLANSAAPLSNRAKTSNIRANRDAEVTRQPTPPVAERTATVERPFSEQKRTAPSTNPTSAHSEYDGDLSEAFSNWGTQ
jgi:hypothetical protein